MGNQSVARIAAGAAIGAGFAYLFWTSNGRRVLDSIEPWLDDLIRDLKQLRAAAAKARDAYEEGRQSLNAVMKLSTLGGERRDLWSTEARH